MPERRPFGRSGLEISPITLGGNVFGWSADEDASFAVLDAYVEAGGNAVDTANTYSAWVPGNRGGESEVIIGRWLAARGGPGDVVVATKVGMAGGEQPAGLGRDRILRAAEGSLERLGVERIALYYAHEDDPATPLEETLGAFDELVRQGLVGAIAASNYSGPRLAEALAVSEREGLVRFEGLQQRFNLLSRDDLEPGAGDVCRREGLGIAAYSSLARGFLSGKYRRGRPLPASARAAGVAASYLDDRGFAALEAVDAVAAAHGATPSQVALAWILARPGMTTALAGANTPGQVRELMGALDLRLTGDELARLDDAGG
ncbi:aldo/keto reductase [Miltoncostaea marina]|uniref:aldo/keto reductase n=1 Tax=Miltoncostaea marina TaxID=2843215 RepID=UPI001C3E76EB|nr:aldo/keto reductase [Miltoncostaea marina]